MRDRLQLDGSRLGANYLGAGCVEFLVWAPDAKGVSVVLKDKAQASDGRKIQMVRQSKGYFHAKIENAPPGICYQYQLGDQGMRPDPASRLQPDGVYGVSEVIDPNFPWDDSHWRGLDLKDYVIYEVHVGTFSEAGTFAGVMEQLDYIQSIGVTALELMPVAQFSGTRNWGYDGVYPFAVQQSYGSPQDLKALVNGCHERGIAVLLDVVYNHLGPEGNYTADFGPYYIQRYKTPWGKALNFDGRGSDEVRRFFIENALYWITEFHMDGLRLDAVHAILDMAPKSFLQELGEAVEQEAERLGRKVNLIAESCANDARLIRSREKGGIGLAGQWSDDLHHSLHTVLLDEREGYYQDYGKLSHLTKAMQSGYTYTGEYSAYLGRKHGSFCEDVPCERFVVCTQNHDQIGNRMLGERLSHLVSFEAAKLAASVVLLSPYTPLLYMGEEYGETAPFCYFVDHSDASLVQAVRKGRREEFKAFAWKGDPLDPKDLGTYERCVLNHGLRGEASHKGVLEFYRELLRLRKVMLRTGVFDRGNFRVSEHSQEQRVIMEYCGNESSFCLVHHFGIEESGFAISLPKGDWHVMMDSASKRWQGPRDNSLEGMVGESSLTLSLFPHSSLLLGTV